MSEWFESLVTVASSAAVSVTASAAIVFLSKTWITERLRRAIEHEYAQRLELFRHTLSSEHQVSVERMRASFADERAVHATAAASFSEGRRAAHARRLAAIENAWQAMVRMTSALPIATTTTDVLVRTEYPTIFQNPKSRRFYDPTAIEEAIGVIAKEGKTFEIERPFLGEYVFSHLEVYRTVLARVLMLIGRGIQAGTLTPWYDDSGVRGLLRIVMTDGELQHFDSLEVQQFATIRWHIEGKVLAHLDRVISGEESGAFGLEQARRLQEAVANYRLDEARTEK